MEVNDILVFLGAPYLFKRKEKTVPAEATLETEIRSSYLRLAGRISIDG